MKKVIVSACLLGENCKYNGGNNYCSEVIKYIQGREVIPVCPEVLAGLGTPRTPIEIRDGKVYDKNGVCVDAAICGAVKSILDSIEPTEIECAILKSRSPTCGVKQIHDGTFSGTLIDGMGTLARALSDAGIKVVDSEDV
ncbi:MAG: DUF523 domain-containing protein [Clostridia bacterium]|nr:DUF523 domain-containing protein [Clostridia bacterium]